MRITNTTGSDITITDMDRGNAGSSDPYTGIYESWNAKSYSVVPADGSINVFDTERVMLSADLGQVKKWVDEGLLTTEYSMAGTEVGPFSIAGSTNDELIVDVDGTVETITLPTGSDVTMEDVVLAINSSASGFSAEEGEFFRSSNTDNTVPGEVDGPSAMGEGQRTESITSGFLVLYSADKLTIGAGSANATLGLIEGQTTLAK